MPDSNNAKNAKDANVKASVKNTKSGKVVNVQSNDRHYDAMGETLKEQNHTIPMVATPGKFANGRSTPGSVAVQKAEAERQDAELEAALKEVEQLKEHIRTMQSPKEEKKAPPPYSPNYGYGDGTGEVSDSGGFTSPQ